MLNLGAEFNLPQAMWKDLANRIEDLIYGQASVTEYPKEVEDLASIYAIKIIGRQSQGIAGKKESESGYIADYQKSNPFMVAGNKRHR